MSGILAAREGGVLRLTMSHPGKRNSLTWEMYEQLEQHLIEAGSDSTLRVLVIRGETGGGFAAGTAIDQFAEFTTGADGREYEARIASVFEHLQAIPVPVVAAVDGAAVGAGLAIAASCDLVIAVRGAVFGAPVARTIGNTVPIHVVARLTARLGAGFAARMLMLGELVPAEELVACGFVTRVVEEAALDEAIDSTAAAVDGLAPLSLRAMKTMTRRLEAAGLPDDSDLLDLVYGSADFRQGVAAFLAKRRPAWEGR